MPKRTTVASESAYRVTIVTLDGHLASAADAAARELRRELPGLELTLHCAGEWSADPETLERCRRDIASADIVVASMLFMDEHIRAVMPALTERREHCDAMVCFMSDGEVIRLTRLGQLSMAQKATGPLALLKRLRGGKRGQTTVGAKQVAMLRRLPRILRFIPGTAQDLRAYFLTMQYWLAGSEENVANLVRFLVNRYAGGDLRGGLEVAPPIDYPDTGVYHPTLASRVSDSVGSLPAPRRETTVGLLLMRSYVLAGNSRHYDAVIAALEARGHRVIPAFASGLDSRPAVERFFIDDNGRPLVDAVVSLTGFSLVGGPAYNDARAAEELLAKLDVPYIAAHATEFQTLEDWERSSRGLLPVETTMMVAIPELDGATSPTLFAGRSVQRHGSDARDMVPHDERIAMLAERVDRMVSLRRKPRAERQIGIVLFNFPPNSGATGTAAYLAVFESLFNTLNVLREAGYATGELPPDVAALRAEILDGNSADFGADANVIEHVGVDDYVRSEPHLSELERQWGPAPGRDLVDGGGIQILGRRYGNVTVAIQPGFGYEGDPMRLLFEHGHTPTHAFSAFYRYLRETVGVDALLNFGTHGALEFMPGKQSGLGAACWPERLLGATPNFYLYAANNPSEGTLAKRRSAATLISYLTPTVTRAGLHRSLGELKSSLDRLRALSPAQADERVALESLIREQAAALELAPADDELDASALKSRLDELEATMIPHGLHVVGEAASRSERYDILEAINSMAAAPLDAAIVERIADGEKPKRPADSDGALFDRLVETNAQLAEDHECAAIVHALDAGFVRPVTGGDLLKSPDILPTGRNIHGFDPFRIPSAFALADGERQAALLIDAHRERHGAAPESVAFVLWGTDNLKTEGGPIAQALALLGARPRLDGYGRLCGAELIPLETLGRPRIDVVMTLSGIFRDLLPQQTQMLAEAAWLAASADEPLESNFVRKHALRARQDTGCDLETAALRVFSNADGAYGANVNHLVDNGRWNDEDELAEAYSRRKCFAFGRDGRPERQPEMLKRSLADVDIAYQNLESIELGVTTIDHYFDTLGGITRAARRASGRDVEVYIGDQTGGRDAVRTLGDQVALETHTRMLNPKWYEGLLEHGYEGVRQIEHHVTNTVGLSATTGKVAPWVYKQITETFVLDPAMREQLSRLNPVASARMAGRLLEAHERDYWSPDDETLEKLRQAGDELDDRLEGVEKVAIA